METKRHADNIIGNIEKVIVGKRDKSELIIAALLAGGHVLLEDVPGTGKTMLSKALAKSIDADFRRIQFTPDLLPSDLIGLNFYNPKTGDFTFRQGALFTNILLADEINRATPRTQSSLLESMEEKQITVDGVTYTLDAPYFVIATQNPIETQGTYPLPEAQLDRFLIRTNLGYLSTSESAKVIRRFLSDNPVTGLSPVLDKPTLSQITDSIKDIEVHDDILTYAVTLAEKTRDDSSVVIGVSTRGALMLVKLAQAYAAVRGNPFVTPDDIKYLLPFVFTHRIIMRSGMRNRDQNIKEVLDSAVSSTTAPTERFRFDNQ